jgi:hypothetical protein
VHSLLHPERKLSVNRDTYFVSDISAAFVHTLFMNRRYSAVALWVLCLGCSMAFAGDRLPPIQSAASDEHGRITVNGKPFFPILMYDVPTDPGSLEMFREHGFNTLAGKPEVSDLFLANGFYTAVHGGEDPVKNLDGVLFGIGMDSPALYWKQNLLKKAQADLVRMRALVPNRIVMNAIGYWEDEPTGVYSNKVPSKERYEELVKVLDVSAPYLYPIPYQPVRSIGEAVERAKTATGGKKPLLPILQLFTWEAKDRYPTPSELKCMVYLSLIHGANGIGYYSYNYVTGKKGTNGEITAICPWLLENIKVSLVLQEGASDVEFRAVSRGGETLLLLANTGSVAKTAVLRFPLYSATKGKRRLKHLGGGKAILFEGSQVQVPLEPYQAVGLIEFGSRGP